MDEVENLSTIVVENSNSLHLLAEKKVGARFIAPTVNKRIKHQKLSTASVDNLVNKCAEVMKMHQTDSAWSEERTPKCASSL